VEDSPVTGSFATISEPMERFVSRVLFEPKGHEIN